MILMIFLHINNQRFKTLTNFIQKKLIEIGKMTSIETTCFLVQEGTLKISKNEGDNFHGFQNI